ncbi:MAG TPA: DUF72 domain-containing protein [Lacipirellulaceae bacterium]|nr:DUF72 domain-containing protein [Lacipirellulaceae bacterium]
MVFFVGTSGYSHDEWKGNFYPVKFSQKKMLAYYAERFSTVEINYTFRNIPSEKTVTTWAAQVPESFRFVLKAWQKITHVKRLQNAEQETDDFLSAASLLQDRQGPILFQLAPTFKKDVSRLEAFLKHVAGRAKVAFEFRHASWLDDEVGDCLRAHSAALCVADGADLPPAELVRTANWGYIRLRNGSYTDEQLGDWIKRIRAHKWDETYVFLMHEDTGTGPKLAARFVELAG